ncbi:MAG: cupin domain-containing protein [Synergistaceae bacterium]|nr:cupin domain-containing protein [Synergistaceae bacterium]
MNIILLSGGSGKRLWPLSNDIRSKQFIKIFKKPAHSIPMGTEYSGKYESMLQRVYRQIRTVTPSANIVIATSKSQVSAIHNQLGVDVDISIEPYRRDTFAAIALATAYLHDVKNIPDNEAVVVCPVDPYVEDDYFRTLEDMYYSAKNDSKNIILMGIEPTYPSEKYGYIKPSNQGYTFTEKPNLEKAAEYISQGAMWNGGVFAYKLRYVLDKSRELLGTSDYEELFKNYESLKKISFDYAVVEHETSIEVIRYSGTWKDLGTWNTLTEAMEGSTVGDVRLNETCSNVHAVNELGLPILLMGLKNIVVSASPEGILVSDKEQSSYIKPFVDDIDQQVMFAEKSWGSYRVLDVEEDSMTIKVTLKPSHRMNYHSHDKRDEIWSVISGEGHTIVDGMKQPVKPGDVITIEAGCKHTIIAGESGLQLIEVQLGKNISVHDKRKYEMPL